MIFQFINTIFNSLSIWEFRITNWSGCMETRILCDLMKSPISLNSDWKTLRQFNLQIGWDAKGIRSELILKNNKLFLTLYFKIRFRCIKLFLMVWTNLFSEYDASLNVEGALRGILLLIQGYPIFMITFIPEERVTRYNHHYASAYHISYLRIIDVFFGGEIMYSLRKRKKEVSCYFSCQIPIEFFCGSSNTA